MWINVSLSDSTDVSHSWPSTASNYSTSVVLLTLIQPILLIRINLLQGWQEAAAIQVWLLNAKLLQQLLPLLLVATGTASNTVGIGGARVLL